ncbi:Hypothetical protein SMAX5B_021898 [Scophthalmus maximus]|uniref:Uncharacterized protein n=1 Tax=Scophthalmus maximus TaxID=52904 RepID=A0A2U9CIJ3_SCOMX|nr:Hypothetical protein SMAX5B_021898 [Scophthalmus maximus]
MAALNNDEYDYDICFLSAAPLSPSHCQHPVMTALRCGSTRGQQSRATARGVHIEGETWLRQLAVASPVAATAATYLRLQVPLFEAAVTDQPLFVWYTGKSFKPEVK